MRVRIRHCGGASTVDVPSGGSVGEVSSLIEAEVPTMPRYSQVWKTGYPPKLFPQCSSGKEFPTDVDMIHVALVGEGESPTISFQSEVAKDEPSMTDPDGIVVRRVIDADNSCLFNSIGYVLRNHSRKEAPQLRQMVATAVREDPVTFTEAFLGKTPEDYIAFITNPKAWGGQIELLVFSQLFKTEIAAFDVIRDRVDIYGTEEDYKQRVFVIYDGIHYDALAFNFDESLPEETDVTTFAPKDQVVLDKARALCAEQHRKKAFTDTSSFSLRCMICQQGLVGASEAQEHAQKTGHTNFAEFS